METIIYSTTQSFWILTMNLRTSNTTMKTQLAFFSPSVSTSYKHCDCLSHKLQFTKVCLNTINIHPVSGEMVFSRKTTLGTLLTVFINTPARSVSQTSSRASHSWKDFHAENKELMGKLPLQILKIRAANASNTERKTKLLFSGWCSSHKRLVRGTVITRLWQERDRTELCGISWNQRTWMPRNHI